MTGCIIVEKFISCRKELLASSLTEINGCFTASAITKAKFKSMIFYCSLFWLETFKARSMFRKVDFLLDTTLDLPGISYLDRGCC